MTARLLALSLVFSSGCTYIHDTRGSSVQVVAGDAAPIDGISTLTHVMWTDVLEAFASDEGVDYDALIADQEHRYILDQYLGLLAAVDPRELDDRDEKLAFYVNLYNAAVVQGVVDRLEETSDFRVDQDGFEFFDAPLVELQGRLLSLNVLEHALIRGDEGHVSASEAALDDEGRELTRELHDDLWSAEPFDPRVHFVLNCASRSCPPLQVTALRGEGLDQTLEAAASSFLLDPDRGAGPNGISRLFEWFTSDFANAGWAEPADFIAEYRALDDVDVTRYLTYDWALNRWSAP